MLISEQIKIIPRKRFEDERGLFLKPLTGLEENIGNLIGEVYITTAKPGKARGNHYHLDANEWFTVVSGEAKLYLEDIESKEKLFIYIKAEDANTYFIPARLAHVFINPIESQTDFMLIAYSNKVYNPADTVPYNVYEI